MHFHLSTPRIHTIPIHSPTIPHLLPNHPLPHGSFKTLIRILVTGFMIVEPTIPLLKLTLPTLPQLVLTQFTALHMRMSTRLGRPPTRIVPDGGARRRGFLVAYLRFFCAVGLLDCDVAGVNPALVLARGAIVAGLEADVAHLGGEVGRNGAADGDLGQVGVYAAAVVEAVTVVGGEVVFGEGDGWEEEEQRLHFGDWG